MEDLARIAGDLLEKGHNTPDMRRQQKRPVVDVSSRLNRRPEKYIWPSPGRYWMEEIVLVLIKALVLV